MKSTFSTKRRFSCFIATIIWIRLEMSLPPPVPGRRVVGLSGSPMNELLRLPYWSIGAPQHHVRAPRTALLVGRRRKLTGFDERPNRTALEEDCKTRAMQALHKS